jgi:hypothetical protein
MRLAALFVPALFVLAGCPSGDLAEGPYCEDTRTALGADEVSALGFSPADVLADVPESENVGLVYADNSLSQLAVAFAPGAAAWFVDSEAVYPDTGGPQPAIGVICDDRVEIEGTLSFVSEDGAFAESFDAVLSATAESTSLHQELDLDALVGTFDIVPFIQAEDYTDVSAWIDITFADGVSVGVVAGQVSGEEACEDSADCAAWAEAVDVGTWPAAL